MISDRRFRICDVGIQIAECKRCERKYIFVSQIYFNYESRIGKRAQSGIA
jgi:hypothetical protein